MRLVSHSGTRMGKHDNRRSKKMRQRVSQKKYKARVKKQKAERRAARGTPSQGPEKVAKLRRPRLPRNSLSPGLREVT